MKILKFNEMYKINENVSLSKEEVEFLWKKIEYRKRKKASEDKNELFKLLNSNKTSFTDDEFIKILNALEYTFKKNLKAGTLKTELGKSLINKLPPSWIGIKYSNLKAKSKRDAKKND